jgi:periplasmic protein CpxP/Spy
MMMKNESKENTTAKNGNATPAGPAPVRRWYGVPAAAIVLALGVGAAGVIGSQAVADGKDSGGWRNHARMEDPAAREQRMERGIRHLAVEIDATAEQQAALIELASGTIKDLHAFRDMMRDDAGELASLLTAATVDRNAIEAFRLEKMAELDKLTSQLVDVAAKAGEILTPEQRTKIAAFFEERREHRGMRRGGEHRGMRHGWKN